MFRVCALGIIAILALSSMSMLEHTKAQTQNITTFCSIITEPQNIIQGNTFTVVAQMSPAPPDGERFNDLYVDIISAAQGVSGYGPWSVDDVSTDSAGVARVNFNIQNYNGYITVEVYFAGQYFSNGTIYYDSGHWSNTFIIHSSQKPSPIISTTPTVPEFSMSAVLCLLVVLPLVAVVLVSKKRKRV